MSDENEPFVPQPKIYPGIAIRGNLYPIRIDANVGESKP
jgi:hypothetical protein